MTDIPLPLPESWTSTEARRFLRLCTELGDAHAGVPRVRVDSANPHGNPSVAAASAVVADLADQGWLISVIDGSVRVKPPSAETDAEAERTRVRRQELIKRDEQLRQPSVARFVSAMEEPREYGGRFVSIFSLMRDGRELAEGLGALGEVRDQEALRALIDPYVQIVEAGQRCERTGLRLTDVWRYFRLTWSNQHTSTPGRTMMLLVRDRAAPDHPVIGIAALASAVVQIRERDDWIGWQPEALLSEWTGRPSARLASWVLNRLESSLQELYLDDLIQDGLYWPSLWTEPTTDAVDKLRIEAQRSRIEHQRFQNRTQSKVTLNAANLDEVRDRARHYLFRSKRAAAVADVLEARRALLPYLGAGASRDGLRRALADPTSRRAISGIIRRAKGEAVGTEIADLSVCGAVAPYNELVGGKLVAMLAVSPTAVRAYHDRYGDYASQIASSMAGRPIRRRNNLVFVGTTSLYGVHSSQYNRLSLPGGLLGGHGEIRYQKLGRSRSFGTSHLSDVTVRALVSLSEQSHNGVRVNSIFGEGVNPKLRKVREGLDLIGWPAEQLLQHRRQRILYGVSLVDNLLPYLLGLEGEPDYRFDGRRRDDVTRIVSWWMTRWLGRRTDSPAVLERVRQHSPTRPVTHGARVTRPEAPTG
jgi:hypothetical protein